LRIYGNKQVGGQVCWEIAANEFALKVILDIINNSFGNPTYNSALNTQFQQIRQGYYAIITSLKYRRYDDDNDKIYDTTPKKVFRENTFNNG
jgi:hypothetical protein